MAAFLKEFSSKALRIVTPCDVSAFLCGSNLGAVKPIHCESALWDTGASVSVISSRVASELHLSPTGVSYVSGFDGKKIKTNTYRIDIRLSEEMEVNFVEVVESPMIIFDLIIGMDIIEQGDFAVKNLGIKGTHFSFCMDP